MTILPRPERAGVRRSMPLHPDRLVLPSALGLLIVDRALKGLVLRTEPFAVLPAVRFELFRNEGIAFSIGLGGPLVWIMSLLVLAAVGGMAARDIRARRTERIFPYALFALGAFSNLYDRVAYGHVVDYLIFFGRSAVNLADGMIVAGALMLIFDGRKARV